MPVMQRTAQRTEGVLRQMVDLLEELCIEYAQEDEADRAHPQQERDIIATLEEEAADRGMNEEHVGKILRSALHMAKEGRET